MDPPIGAGVSPCEGAGTCESGVDAVPVFARGAAAAAVLLSGSGALAAVPLSGSGALGTEAVLVSAVCAPAAVPDRGCAAMGDTAGLGLGAGVAALWNAEVGAGAGTWVGAARDAGGMGVAWKGRGVRAFGVGAGAWTGTAVGEGMGVVAGWTGVVWKGRGVRLKEGSAWVKPGRARSRAVSVSSVRCMGKSF